MDVHSTLLPNPPGLHSLGQVSWGGKVLQLSVRQAINHPPPNWGCSGTLSPFQAQLMVNEKAPLGLL